VSRYIDDHRGRFGVEPICRILGVSAAAYHQRATGKRSARQLEDERLLERISEVHETNYCAYGYRRTWKALWRAGEHAPRRQVQRLMRANGIQGAKRRGKPWRTTTPDSDARRPPDLVNRDFTAWSPSELWVADFSYLRCWEGVMFFSFVIDVYSRKVVGWQFASHMRTTLVLDALRMALASVGSTGDAYDNSMAQSFVDSFETELIADRVWRTRSQMELAIVEYIAWLNDTRPHENLDDRPPREIEELYAVKAQP
jgi:putative transposase